MNATTENGIEMESLELPIQTERVLRRILIKMHFRWFFNVHWFVTVNTGGCVEVVTVHHLNWDLVRIVGRRFCLAYFLFGFFFVGFVLIKTYINCKSTATHSKFYSDESANIGNEVYIMFQRPMRHVNSRKLAKVVVNKCSSHKEFQSTTTTTKKLNYFVGSCSFQECIARCSKYRVDIIVQAEKRHFSWSTSNMVI